MGLQNTLIHDHRGIEMLANKRRPTSYDMMWLYDKHVEHDIP